MRVPQGTFGLKAKVAGAILVGALAIGSMPVEAGETPINAQSIDIGSRRQFWFNTQNLIVESTHLRLLQQRPVKHPSNPLVVADRPWEGTLIELYTSDVLYDAESGHWQLWYDAHPGEVIMCTALSKDGLRWTKPELGLQSWQGSTKNNIVLQTGNLDGNGSTIVKTPEEKDPAKRYKLYYWVAPQWFDLQIKYSGYGAGDAGLAAAREKIKRYPTNGWYVAYSSDGVDFKPQLSSPVLTTSDYATVFYDEQAGKYRSYHKIEYQKPEWLQSRRCMWTSESEDGLHFGKSTLTLIPDEADDAWAKASGGNRVEFYGMHVWPQDGFYLGLVWVFLVKHADSRAGYDDGHILPYLIYSSDGVDWKRLPVREPFIPNGPANSFDGGSVYTTGDHPVVIGDEVRFYYNGCAYTHGFTEPFNSPSAYTGFGLATLPRDRYMGWQGAAMAGTLSTKPLKFQGKALVLNLDATRGQTLVALLDAGGKPLPGFSLEDCERISADSFSHVVKWRGTSDLSALSGKEVCVQFSLRQSVLYTWQFK